MIKAFAKVNLRLEIEKKLDNGFHYLHMINSKIDLYDEIYIEPSLYNKVEFSIATLNNDKNNIVFNIIDYMQKTYNIKERINIYIRKNIPIGSGLGGGSADGAAVLHYFNTAYNLGLTIEELSMIGFKFGSDIPYCLHQKTSYVYGIGENIYELNIKPIKAILVCPNIHIDTKQAFESNKVYNNKISLDIAKNLVNDSISKLFKNDFLEQTIEKYDKIKEIYIYLKNNGIVNMSGTGPSMIFIPKENFNINELKCHLADCKIFNIYIKE